MRTTLILEAGGTTGNTPLIAQSQWRGGRIKSLPANYVINVWPEEGYEHGREAAGITLAWQDASSWSASGLLLLGCDVAADPDDLEAMTLAVLEAPKDVHTGMVKLWPASTGRPDWIWSHRGGTLGNPAATQDGTAPVAYFSLGFLWCPARLLDLAAPVMTGWQWGQTDVRLSEIALEHAIPAHSVPGCRPKHIHF